MKRINFQLLALIFCQAMIGQVGVGTNASYNRNNDNYEYANRSILDVKLDSENDMFVSIKGLANIKADTYIATFSVTQNGKTAQEVNELIDKRINQSVSEIKLKKNVETFIDMISFVPVYEYETEKKNFSRKTYNEIPAGFELKKNILIKYSDPNQLNDIISILSNNEIYDLARNDYYSDSLESIKKEMMNKAKLLVQEKIKNYEILLGQSLADSEKKIIDGYTVNYPIDMYKSYEASNSSSLNLKKTAPINQVSKSTTIYYQPILNKEFDFVINPTLLEPAIQIQYEVKIAIKTNKPAKMDKNFVLITPNGELKALDTNTTARPIR
ncbi:hypothetical protein ASE40_02725 [Flavobacterium sp. Root935]|uniref:SIMPL domain-containing protein n=1 Tax=Flavobacterium sp. Root935 TaxID=1736610 RepID=UPI00070DCDC4|nr:SIMPL domain-containing protein [Flavobacterium sp. Root935]KRD62719.1 hypothetical protein ASE40_02725 [Flavobacterium sp. Root935]